MRHRRLRLASRPAALLALGLLAACADLSVAPSADRREPAAPPPAAITLTFDDGRLGVHRHALPILQSLGMRANVAVMTTRFWDQQLDWAQLRALRDAGWSVVSHSMTHPLLTQLPRDSAWREVSESRRVIDSLGFHAAVFTVPYLDHNATVLGMVADAGYRYARCCVLEPGWTTDTLLDWPIALAARHRLVGVDLSDYGRPSAYNFRTADGRERLRTLLADVAARGKFVDLLLHEITAADTADLRATLEIVAAHRAHLVTYDTLR